MTEQNIKNETQPNDLSGEEPIDFQFPKNRFLFTGNMAVTEEQLSFDPTVALILIIFILPFLWQLLWRTDIYLITLSKWILNR